MKHGRMPSLSSLMSFGIWAGAAVPIVTGIFWLIVWGAGRAHGLSAAGTIVMKTNMAAAQVVAGAALAMLAGRGVKLGRRWPGLILAGLVLLTGAITLSQYLFGWDAGIDQLLATEPPGAPATTSPNRMGPPGSTSLVLAGCGLLALGVGAHSLSAAFAIGLGVVNLTPMVGYLCGIRELYSQPGVTGVAWSTVTGFLCLGMGLLFSSSKADAVAVLSREDPGGAQFRRYLPAVIGLPLVLGFLTALGQRRGLYDPAFGSGLLIILLILALGGLSWRSANRLSRAAAAEARSRAELAEQREWLRVTLQSIGDAVITCDTDGRVTFLNEVAAALTGWKREEALGQPLQRVFRITNERNDQPTFDPVARVLQEKKTLALTNHTALLTRDGHTVPIEDSAAPILGEDHVLRGAVLVFHDVTERRRAEQLVESTALFPAENPFPVLRLSSQGILLYANPASAELLRQWQCQIGQMPPEEVCGAARRAIDTRERQELDVSCDGRDLSLVVAPARDRDYVNIYGRDMTERNRAQAALADARDQLAQANQALELKVEERTARLRETIADLEQFSYSIAHDLRAPLRSMSSFSSILLEDYGSRLDSEGREYLRRIESAASRMDELIRDVLTYSRVVRSDLTLVPVDLDHLVREVIDQYPQFSADRVEITMQTPLAAVAGSPALLTQCVSNYLDNAAKFVPPGVKPNVKVWTESSDGWVRFCVQDNGIGIEATHLDRIWRIFERVHDPQQFEGTGIGLSIVKRAIERMGGQVGVQSIPGNGSTFWFQLSPG